MNKPSWDEAPEWAHFLAQDEDGSWWWFEFGPKPANFTWAPPYAGGRYAQPRVDNPNWRDTLERRPGDSA